MISCRISDDRKLITVSLISVGLIREDVQVETSRHIFKLICDINILAAD